jgi:serine/threonine protein kinase
LVDCSRSTTQARVKRGESSKAAGDIYSLGVILWELLTGGWHFGDPEMRVHALRRAVDPAGPPQPAATLRKALAADPEQRHPSVRNSPIAAASSPPSGQPATHSIGCSSCNRPKCL